ncbi:MAG: sulfatase-like hydrolase/transferase [Terriglobales bacterium]|jgi:arylsulfatase A-like enzyme
MTTMNRKEFLKVAGSGLLLPFLTGGDNPLAAWTTDDVPNVLLIISDDQQYNELGCLNESVRTPNLDRLAQRGVRFANTFANTSLCAPGRACILTGLYSRQSGVTDNDLIMKEGDSLIPSLHKAGYLTGLTGKWHWPLFPEISQFGFDWQDFFVPSPMVYAHPTYAYHMAGEQLNPVPVSKEQADTSITDTAISFIKNNKDRRFFLWLAYFSPHGPWLMPRPFAEMYDPSKMKLPPSYVSADENRRLHAASPASSADGILLYPADGRVDPGKNFGGPSGGPEETRKLIASHHGLVSYMDDQIGRLLSTLQDLGLSEKTLIIFVTDNGYMLGDHGYEGKAFLYEESIRLPLIMSWPGRYKPRVVDELVYIMDILPTVMDVARVPIPSGLAGKSLLPLLEGRQAHLRDEIFCEYYPRGWKAVRTREWKYIFTPELGEELYHVAEDPYEMKNLAGEPGRQAILRKLKADWKAWEDAVGQPKTFSSGVLFAGEEAWEYWKKQTAGPNDWRAEQLKYYRSMQRARRNFAALARNNKYDPQVLMDIGGWGVAAWLDVLAAEGRLTPNLTALGKRLKSSTYAEQVGSPNVRATMQEFLKELVKDDSLPRSAGT